MGDFTDLVFIGEEFFPRPLELDIFSPTYNVLLRFFFQHYTS